jgi:hypothetical protein
MSAMGNDDPAGRERRKRNTVLALVLGAFGILIYLMSIVQWHEHFGK